MDPQAAATTTDTKRYDRQLRLWGEEGQARLEGSNICLLNATATGSETLKNLVLPGIGAFTVVDNNKVTDSDFNNFFVEESGVGQSRASVVTRLLNELNDRVRGSAHEADPIQLIQNNIDYFKQFNVIIASDLPEQPVLKLAKFAWDHNIAFFVLKTSGFIGYIRTAIPEHRVIESKPDNPPDDLRLSAPFPELSQYAASFNLETMDSTEHSHVPYVVILLQAIEKWKASHGGQIPQSYADKKAFRDEVIRGSKKTDEENFGEAFKAAHKAYTPYSIPSSTLAVLNDPKTHNLTANSHNFWIIAAAVREFVENEGQGKLPLMGAIPDMTANTDGYIALQKLYADKANRDAEAVANRVVSILSRLNKPTDTIKFEEVKKFCRNAMFLQVTRFRSLEEERDPKTAKAQYIASQLSEPNNNIVWYLLLRAADAFFTAHGRYPGSDDDKVADDVKGLHAVLSRLLTELNIPTTAIEEKYVQEKVRFGGSELHTIAALLGGVASQEVIKVITAQYLPADNTYVFNGVHSTSGAYSV